MNREPEIHTIRLHGPWVAKVLASFSKGCGVADDRERRVKIPSDWSDWLGPTFCGRVAYRRNFNRPTTLEPGQRVWLVVDEVDFHGEVFLNDSYLGGLTLRENPLRVEVAELLQFSNVLRVEIAVDTDSDRESGAGGFIGSVRIEIQQ